MARRDTGRSILARLIDSFRPPLEPRLFNVYVNNLMCLPKKLIIMIIKKIKESSYCFKNSDLVSLKLILIKIYLFRICGEHDRVQFMHDMLK